MIKLKPVYELDDELCEIDKKDFWKVMPLKMILTFISKSIEKGLVNKKIQKEIEEFYKLDLKKIKKNLSDEDFLKIYLFKKLEKIFGEEIFDWAHIIASKLLLETLSIEFFDLYRPLYPKGENMGRSDFAYDCLKQYASNPKFKFFAHFPIHLDSEILINQKNSKEKRFFAFIINLSFLKKGKENKDGGNHWVSLFYDSTKNYFEYYDSKCISLESNNENILALNTIIDKIYLIMLQLFPNLKPKLYFLGKEKQQNSTLCCEFVVYFIITRIREKNQMIDIENNQNIDDNLIKNYKFIFWNHKK